MNKLNICVPSAVSVTASNSAAGWYGGALCIPDADHDFRDEIEQPFFDKGPMDSSDKEAFGRKLMKRVSVSLEICTLTGLLQRFIRIAKYVILTRMAAGN